jgi:hypothetical protein
MLDFSNLPGGHSVYTKTASTRPGKTPCGSALPVIHGGLDDQKMLLVACGFIVVMANGKDMMARDEIPNSFFSTLSLRRNPVLQKANARWDGH